MVLFETIWIVLVVFVFITLFHIEVIRSWNRRFDELQKQRLRYDGEVKWIEYQKSLTE